MLKQILCAKILSNFSMPSPCTFLGAHKGLDAYQCFGRHDFLKHFGFNVSPPRAL